MANFPTNSSCFGGEIAMRSHIDHNYQRPSNRKRKNNNLKMARKKQAKKNLNIYLYSVFGDHFKVVFLFQIVNNFLFRPTHGHSIFLPSVQIQIGCLFSSSLLRVQLLFEIFISILSLCCFAIDNLVSVVAFKTRLVLLRLG